MKRFSLTRDMHYLYAENYKRLLVATETLLSAGHNEKCYSIYPREMKTYVYAKMCARLFIAIIFIFAKN